MEDYQKIDLIRMKELLRHCSEFIAYFEHAETRMIEWKHDIEQQAEQLQSQFLAIKNELSFIQESLSQTNIAQFKKSVESALTQGELQLKSMETTCQQLAKTAQMHQENINRLTEQSLVNLDKQSTDSLHLINAHLSKYDVHQFHLIASESCDHVHRVAADAVDKSTRILKTFNLKLGLMLVFTTLLSAFFYSLYLNDELPWETHHHVMNERQAGKVLLHAWPKLTEGEKAKILDEPNFDQG